jgi:hypothetical protein
VRFHDRQHFARWDNGAGYRGSEITTDSAVSTVGERVEDGIDVQETPWTSGRRTGEKPSQKHS